MLSRSNDARARDRDSAADVLAVVVTYNPDSDLKDNLAALRGQVGTVLIVDNASFDRSAIENAASELGCRLIVNALNVGVATAFNQAAQGRSTTDFNGWRFSTRTAVSDRTRSRAFSSLVWCIRNARVSRCLGSATLIVRWVGTITETMT